MDLDHLSRLYNVAFIRNDARPGGFLAVDTSTMSDRDMDRFEDRFLPGAEYAGHLSVIGSGPGGMNYVDLAARPREMAYEHAAQNAKVEILAAFGVPESVTGNASGRTRHPDQGTPDQQSPRRIRGHRRRLRPGPPLHRGRARRAPGPAARRHPRLAPLAEGP
ncbi:hypothetical protein AOB60_00780 [Streptomyces noursei]|uniref:Uncharacterized protein n=1 Tax=Streptomyces noursei TaxID=1971 RepID=A0A2N8PR21_STRNR|nr:hypothetical protein AOB60_00780 [Streptomyces noursei]